jgi:hypothetical protein
MSEKTDSIEHRSVAAKLLSRKSKLLYIIHLKKKEKTAAIFLSYIVFNFLYIKISNIKIFALLFVRNETA